MSEKDIISDSLNMNPIIIEREDNRALPTTYRPSLENDNELETDIKYVRQNLYDVIEKTFGAVDELRAIADQSQHPRSYEVLATMVRALVDTNKDLLDMHEKKKKLQGDMPEKEETKTVNNNLFVGSTSELLNMMNKQNEPN